MHEEYFGWPVVTSIPQAFWFRLKLQVFGKKLTERSGQLEAVWYAYNGKLYMTKYSAIGY